MPQHFCSTFIQHRTYIAKGYLWCRVSQNDPWVQTRCFSSKRPSMTAIPILLLDASSGRCPGRSGVRTCASNNASCDNIGRESRKHSKMTRLYRIVGRSWPHFFARSDATRGRDERMKYTLICDGLQYSFFRVASNPNLPRCS